jgi:hypothetical protein
MSNFQNICSRLFVLGLALVALLTLSACNRGGGGDDAPPVSTSTTSSGVASKGIVQNGDVTAEELDINGNVV